MPRPFDFVVACNTCRLIYHYEARNIAACEIHLAPCDRCRRPLHSANLNNAQWLTWPVIFRKGFKLTPLWISDSCAPGDWTTIEVKPRELSNDKAQPTTTRPEQTAAAKKE